MSIPEQMSDSSPDSGKSTKALVFSAGRILLLVVILFPFVGGSIASIFAAFQRTETAAAINADSNIEEVDPDDLHWIDLISVKRMKMVRRDGKFFYLDPKSQKTVPIGELSLVGFSDQDYFNADGMAKVYVHGEHFPVWINLKGEEVIMPYFHEQHPFDDYGLALVRFNNKYGWINRKKEFVIPLRYDMAKNFNSSHGLAWVMLDGKYGWINRQGEEVVPLRFDAIAEFSNGLTRVKENGKYGFFNAAGKPVIEPQFDEIKDFNVYDLAMIKVNDKYGWINIKGEEVVPPRFDSISESTCHGRLMVKGNGYNTFYELMMVKENGKYGIFNSQGKEVLAPRFDGIECFNRESLAKITINGKQGFVDGEWKEIIPPRFDEVGHFDENGMAKVKINDKYGFINLEGEEVIPIRFE